MGKYDKRSESVRKNLIAKWKELVESRGFTFIDLEVKDTNYYIHYQDGDVIKCQHSTSFKRGLKTQAEYLKEVMTYPRGQGVYRFFIGEEIVYVGKTKHFHERFSQHFSKEKSVIREVKHLITKIEYVELNDADTNVYEQWLIAKLKPRLNTADVPVSEPSFDLPELTYKTYRVEK